VSSRPSVASQCTIGEAAENVQRYFEKFRLGQNQLQKRVMLPSNLGTVNSGRVNLNVVAGNRYCLDIELAENFNGAIKVVANEV